MTIETNFANYQAILECLTQETLNSLDDVLALDVRFSDPFHQTKGKERMKQVFQQLFTKTENVSFQIEGSAFSGKTVYFRWSLTATLSGKPWLVNGMTYTKFNAAGLVTEHLEYWDAASQLYEKFPIIGPFLRFLRRQIAA